MNRRNQTLLLTLSMFAILSVFAVPATSAPGDLDPTFGTNGKILPFVGGGADMAKAVIRQSNGRLVVVGHAGNSGAVVRYNANGTRDTTFGINGQVYFGPQEFKLNAVAINPTDGGILIAGQLLSSPRILKLTSAGAVDTSFGVGGSVLIGVSGAFSRLFVTSDQKIVVGGNEAGQGLVYRLNSNGTVDTTFGSSGKVVMPAFADVTALLADGSRILVGGGRFDQNSTQRSGVIRLTSAGNADSSFGTGGLIIISAVDDAAVYALAILPTTAGEERLLVGHRDEICDALTCRSSGNVSSYLAVNGTVDNAFGTGGRVILRNLYFQPGALRIQFTNGVASRIVVGSTAQDPTGFPPVFSTGQYTVTRLLLEGSLDTGFGSGTGSAVLEVGYQQEFSDLLIQPADNKYVLTGAENFDFRTVRLNPNGTYDTTFSGDGKLADDIGDSPQVAREILIQPDGKAIVAGDRAIARFNPDGSFDTAFGNEGRAFTRLFSIDTLSLQNDGKMVLTGFFIDLSDPLGSFLSAVRLNSNGTIDQTFGDSGYARIQPPGVTSPTISSVVSSAIQPDGSILLAGSGRTNFGSNNNDFLVLKFLSNGSIDTSFDADGMALIPIGTGTDECRSIKLQADDKMLLGGSTSNGTNLDFGLARLNPDGSLDTTFSFDGRLTLPMGSGDDVVNSIAVANGKIVAAGRARNGTNNDFAVARFNADGSVDNSFGTNGRVVTAIGSLNDAVNGVVVQTDGKIVAAGATEVATNSNNFAVVRYLANGTPDNSFGPSADNYGNNGIVTIDFGGNDLANALALDSSGRAVVAGSSNDRFAIARLLGGFAPTSAAVSIGGRVVNSNGAGIVRATVTVTNSRGEATSARTSTFGYFRIDGIEAGQTVTLTVDSKRYRFSPRLIDVVDKVEDVVIVAND